MNRMRIRGLILLGLTILIFSCTHQPVATPEVSPTPIPASTLNALHDVRWNIYSPDPQHLWNRLFRQLYRRITNDGREFDWDSLDPLLYYDTTYLLEGDSYQEAVSVLDEFLSTNGEDLITDPLKRAIFQRDLWAVFDWLTFQSDNYPKQRQELEWRLAKIIRKVALTNNEILSLPNNYEAAIRSKTFAISYQRETPDIGFLPPSLLEPNSEWVCLGREGGPIAMTHTEEFPFFGRSVFLVFIRAPGGRDATLRFLQELNAGNPSTEASKDLEVALVRRAMLIDDQGEIILSPLIESIQIRHFAFVDVNFNVQNFYEFALNRAFLFAGVSGGLQPITKEIMVFRSHGDIFQTDWGVEEASIPDVCTGCHVTFEGGLTMSILSHSRFRFPLSDQTSPVLIERTPEFEAQTVIHWKQKHQTWQAFEVLR